MADCYLNKWICKPCYNGLCNTHQREFERYPISNLESIKCIYCNNIAEHYICALDSEFRKGCKSESI